MLTGKFHTRVRLNVFKCMYLRKTTMLLFCSCSVPDTGFLLCFPWLNQSSANDYNFIRGKEKNIFKAKLKVFPAKTCIWGRSQADTWIVLHCVQRPKTRRAEKPHVYLVEGSKHCWKEFPVTSDEKQPERGLFISTSTLFLFILYLNQTRSPQLWIKRKCFSFPNYPPLPFPCSDSLNHITSPSNPDSPQLLSTSHFPLTSVIHYTSKKARETR